MQEEFAHHVALRADDLVRGLPRSEENHSVNGMQIDGDTIEGHYNGSNVAFIIQMNPNGTVTLTQPLIAPLYEGRSAHEVLSVFTSQPDRRTLAIVKDYWTKAYASGLSPRPLADTAMLPGG